MRYRLLASPVICPITAEAAHPSAILDGDAPHHVRYTYSAPTRSRGFGKKPIYIIQIRCHETGDVASELTFSVESPCNKQKQKNKKEGHNNTNTLYIEQIETKDAHRWQGLAKQLLRSFLDFAHQNNIEYMRLNVTNVAFWEKYGITSKGMHHQVSIHDTIGRIHGSGRSDA